MVGQRKTEQQQKISAEALLELGVKRENIEGLINDEQDTGALTEPSNQIIVERHLDSAKDVEEEVMKLVGSTLDHNKSNSRKRNFPNEDDMSQLEFQQWTTGFLADELDDEVDGQGDYSFPNAPTLDDHDQHHHDGDVHHENEHEHDHGHHQSNNDISTETTDPELVQVSKKQKKLAKKDALTSSTSSTTNEINSKSINVNVNPELEHLDTSSFVQDAMIDARTLASLGSIDHEYLRQAVEGQHESSAVDEVQHLAVQAVKQAVAAAQAAQAAQAEVQNIGAGDQSTRKSQIGNAFEDSVDDSLKSKVSDLEKLQKTKGILTPDSAILSSEKLQQQQLQQKLQKQKEHKQQQLRKQEQQQQQQLEKQKQQQNEQRLRGAELKLDSQSRDPKFSALTSALVAEAAKRANSYVSGHQNGRSFSKEESDAIDIFVADYCKINNNMTREDICKRIWANERKKDDFWESLQKVLPERTRASLYKHVRRSYHIFKQRGKWTPADDAKLAELASQMEGQWKLIGQELCRMPEDCRDRWRNYVKCGDQRKQHKWTFQEEEKLRSVVHRSLSEQRLIYPHAEPIINWTLVSEWMGGTRSRIQCRYKWNKILKRETNARARTIDTETKSWMLSRLKMIYEKDGKDEIDWDTLASIHEDNSWTGPELKKCFEKMASTVEDYKNKSFVEIVDILNDSLAPSLYLDDGTTGHGKGQNNSTSKTGLGSSNNEFTDKATSVAATSGTTQENDHEEEDDSMNDIRKLMKQDGIQF